MFTKQTKIWFLFLSLLAFFNISGFSQSDLSGRVEDEYNNKAIADANVFFNNTSIGAITDQQGKFSFTNLRLSNIDIIVFSPGYELLVFRPTPQNVKGRNVVFRLKRKMPESTKLVIDERSRKLAIGKFCELLLGATREADDCKLINDGAIYFLQGENQKQFRMLSNVPLSFVNERLGYKISYYLLEWSFNDSTKQAGMYGFVKYESFNDGNRYRSNRKKVYQGSTLHFFRSLVKHQLYQQNFEVYLMNPVVDSATLQNPPKNLLITYTDMALIEPISAQDLLYIDSANEISIRTNKKLMIYYSKNPSGRYDMAAHGLTEGLLVKGVQSFIDFNQSPVGINYNGVLADYSNVKFSGYWSHEQLANKLPLDYEPDN